MICVSRSLAVAVAMLALATYTAAQEPEIYNGPSTDAPSPTSPAPKNHLAKCLADPDDVISCYIAQTAENDGGLESAIQGQMDTASYVTCEKASGVCLELATLDLLDEEQTKPVGKLASVDITILFDYDSSDIRPGEDAKLVQLTAAINNPLNVDAAFAVIGHTDSKGTKEYNCGLSLARAEAVVARFAELGVASEQLTAIGAGEHVLRNESDGEAGENRRVGFARFGESGRIVTDRLARLCEHQD